MAYSIIVPCDLQRRRRSNGREDRNGHPIPDFGAIDIQPCSTMYRATTDESWYPLSMREDTEVVIRSKWNWVYVRW